jgi:hypothetical protein
VTTYYNAEISAGSLMPLESRRIAEFLLTNPDDVTWRRVLVEDNLLQKKSPATTLRQAKLIRNRLTTLDSSAWEMIAHREQEVTIQLLLIAAVRHSQLLADFIADVYKEHQRRLNLAISPRDWEGFFVECTHRDASVSQWSASTQAKLFQVILRILTEAKYLDNTRNMTLTPQSLHPDVRRYLSDQSDYALLNLLEKS